MNIMDLFKCLIPSHTRHRQILTKIGQICFASQPCISEWWMSLYLCNVYTPQNTENLAEKSVYTTQFFTVVMYMGIL